MAIGCIICLSGCVATLISLFPSEQKNAASPVYIFYGAVGVGGGQFLWGLEQVTNCRLALKQFDALWKEAIA
jgi:hypothetical protein